MNSRGLCCLGGKNSRGTPQTTRTCPCAALRCDRIFCLCNEVALLLHLLPLALALLLVVGFLLAWPGQFGRRHGVIWVHASLRSHDGDLPGHHALLPLAGLQAFGSVLEVRDLCTGKLQELAPRRRGVVEWGNAIVFEEEDAHATSLEEVLGVGFVRLVNGWEAEGLADVEYISTGRSLHAV